MYEDTGRHNVLGVQRAQFYHLVHGGYGFLGSGSHDGTKVSRCLAVGQVAPAVALLGLDERYVGMNGELKNVMFAPDFARFLQAAIGILSQLGAITCGREESPNTRASSTYTLGQIALRDQLKLDLPGAEKPIEDLRVGLSWKTADHLAYTAGLEQRGQS